MTEWKRVILETPYSGAVKRHKMYARLAAYDCIRRHESPYASHLLLTQFLDDNDTLERTVGIEAGFAWRQVADYTVFYCDFGFSRGMLEGFKHCKLIKMTFQIRTFWTKRDEISLPAEIKEMMDARQGST